MKRERNIEIIVAVLTASFILFSAKSFALEASDEPVYSITSSFEFFRGSAYEDSDVKIKLGDEKEKKEQKDKKENKYVGGWGGPLYGYMQIDLSPLKPLTRKRGLDEFNNQFNAIGGMGGVFYKNWIFGGFGFGASQEIDDDVNGKKREAEVALGGGGLFLEYNVPVSKLSLIAGGMVGAGGMTLYAKGDDIGADEEWKESEGFWFGYPYAGLGFKATNWLKFELVAGYMFFDIPHSEFELNGKDMASDNIQGGPLYELRLLFGYEPEK